MSKDIEKFLEYLDKIVNSDGRSWKDKKTDIVNSLSGVDRTNLAEFLGWFEDGELE